MKKLIPIITLAAASGLANVNADDYEQRRLQNAIETQRIEMKRQRAQIEQMRREAEYEAARQRSQQRAAAYSNR